jgi:hypothetical protein
MVGIAAAIAFVFGASVLIAEIVSASTDEHGGGRNAVTGFGNINTESPLTPILDIADAPQAADPRLRAVQ